MAAAQHVAQHLLLPCCYMTRFVKRKQPLAQNYHGGASQQRRCKKKPIKRTTSECVSLSDCGFVSSAEYACVRLCIEALLPLRHNDGNKCNNNNKKHIVCAHK